MVAQPGLACHLCAQRTSHEADWADSVRLTHANHDWNHGRRYRPSWLVRLSHSIWPELLAQTVHGWTA
jgi:hypothetical protein